MVYGISKELARRGHEVIVYTSDVDNDYSRVSENIKEIDGIEVHYFRNLTTKTTPYKVFIVPSMVSTLKKTIKSFDVIHIHGHRSFQTPEICKLSKSKAVPYIIQAHGTLPRIMAKQRLKWIYDVFFGYRLLRDASKVIALSQTEVEQYMGMGVAEEKIAVIPNGIDLSEYGDLPPKGCFKKRFGIDEDEKIVLYLGRIHRIKGIDILVKAFARIVEKLDDVRLVVVGPDDGFLGELEALTKALKIEDNVLISDALYGKDKLEAYVDADVYVLPSRYETFPMSLLEAYSCAKPVVCSKVCGLKDLVIDGVTGLLVEEEDVSQLAHSILSMLNADDRAKEMGMRGKRFVKKSFTLEKVVDKLEKLYEDVLPPVK